MNILHNCLESIAGLALVLAPWALFFLGINYCQIIWKSRPSHWRKRLLLGISIVATACYILNAWDTKSREDEAKWAAANPKEAEEYYEEQMREGPPTPWD